MFESTLTTSWNARSRFGLSTLTSFGLEALLLAALLIVPLLTPPAIPLLRRLSTPISLSLVAAEAAPRVEHSSNLTAHSNTQSSAAEIILRQPAQIPNHILMISEPAPPAITASSLSGAGATGISNVIGVIGASGTSSAPVIPKPAVTAEHPIRLSHMSEGDLIRKVMPAYPALARSARIQGTVVLQAMISKRGTIENLRILSGHPMLAPAAIEAVIQWRYRPYILNSEPVEVETQITVNFSLAGN